MRFGRGRWHWYDIIIVGLAAVIVYPDKVLDWIGEHTGRVFGWRHVVLVEAVAITLMFVAMALLMPAYPRLQWWHPLVFIGILALFRGIMWFIIELFGFRDS
jgi:inner membrane protein involved in colicin E2 resistance